MIILFVCLSLYLRFFQKNPQFYQISYVILNFIMHILDETLQFYHKKISTFLFNWILILFLWVSLHFSFFQKIFNFIHYLVLSSILSHICLMKIFSSLWKCLHFLFLHSNCIYMPMMICEFFKDIKFYKLHYVILIFSIHILDENLKFYMKISSCVF